MRPAHAWANRVTRCASSSVSSHGTSAVSIRWRQPLELAYKKDPDSGPREKDRSRARERGDRGKPSFPAEFPAIRLSLAGESGRFVIFETAERKALELFPADNVSKPEPLGWASFTERQLRC